MKRSFIEEVICRLSGLPVDLVNQVSSLFSIEASAGPAACKHAGDGFFPPIVAIQDAVMFNPDLVLRVMSSRNIFYSLNKIDRAKFDNLVSGCLEPELIKLLKALLRSFPGIKVKSNWIWRSGEIDLLVYSESENAVVHFQVKAPLPPQGARMVKAVEDRILEGIKQIKTFRHEGQHGVDQILSLALGQRVENVVLVEAILTRSSIGTDRVWTQLASENIVAANLAIFALVIGDLIYQKREFSVLEFNKYVNDKIREVVGFVNPVWESRPLRMGGRVLNLPNLDLDSTRLGSVQAKVWKVLGRLPNLLDEN